jgi:hypothetical protein
MKHLPGQDTAFAICIKADPVCHLLSSSRDKNPFSLRLRPRSNETFSLKPYPSFCNCFTDLLLILSGVLVETVRRGEVETIQSPVAWAARVETLQHAPGQFLRFQTQKCLGIWDY